MYLRSNWEIVNSILGSCTCIDVPNHAFTCVIFEYSNVLKWTFDHKTQGREVLLIWSLAPFGDAITDWLFAR